MSLIKKTTASVALIAMTSGLFVNGASAYSTAQVEAANKLADAKIIVKQENAADYQLDRQVLRQEIAAVARGLAKVEKTTTCTNVFKDVSATKPNTWACYTVEALANAWLIAKNDKFRPEANITKAESIGMIVKAAYGNEYSYDSTKEGDWQKQVVDFAVSKGIVSSFSNYTTPATRGFVFEAAANTLTDGSNVLCEIFGTCPKEEPKKEEPKENNVVRGDNDLVVSLSPESPSNGMVVAGSDRAKLLAFDVTAGKEDVTLRKATVKFTGLGSDEIVEKLAIYSNDVKLTKGDKKFNNKGVAELSFDRNVVVKAGETKTLFVTATIKPGDKTYNQSVRVSLTNLDASTTVKGAELTGATLTPYLVANRAEVRTETTSANGRVNLGEEANLYNFSVRETTKKEGAVIKSVTFEETSANGVDLDNLSDLSLNIGATKVDATFTYQKSKIVASLNHTVKAGEKVSFVLKGKVTDDLNKTLALKLDNVYSVGANSQVALEDKGTGFVTTTKDVIGTSVNFTFNREGTNEVSKDSDDVKIGELVFNTTSNYNATLTVVVDWTGADKIDNLQLDGSTEDKKAGTTYTFEDVNLNKGTTKLPLTVDIKDNAVDGNKIKFTVSVSKLEDETTGEELNSTNLSKVLNNSQLSKEVTVKEASIKLTAEKANNTSVVPKGNQQVVLYKGKLDLGGGEDITLDELNFEKSSGDNFTDYISGVSLNIGGKTFNGDINDTTINFSSIYAKIEKNSKGVNVLLTATLKDVELETGTTKVLEVKPRNISASADNTGHITTTPSTAVSTKVTLTSKTELKTASVSNELKDNVLAGTDNVEIGAFKLKDTSSDVFFNSFKVKAVAADTSKLSSALKNLRLVEGTKVIAEGGYMDGDYVRFDSFTLPQFGKDRSFKIVADLVALSSAGGDSTPFLGDLNFKEIVVDTTDATVASTWLKANEEVIKVVPAVVTYTVSEKFSKENSQATVKVTVDAGNNDISELKLDSLSLNDTFTFATAKVNSENVSGLVAANPLVLNKDVSNLTSFDVVLTLEAKNDKTVILKKLNLTAKDSEGNSYEVKSITEDLTMGAYTN